MDPCIRPYESIPYLRRYYTENKFSYPSTTVFLDPEEEHTLLNNPVYATSKINGEAVAIILYPGDRFAIQSRYGIFTDEEIRIMQENPGLGTNEQWVLLHEYVSKGIEHLRNLRLEEEELAILYGQLVVYRQSTFYEKLPNIFMLHDIYSKGPENTGSGYVDSGEVVASVSSLQRKYPICLVDTNEVIGYNVNFLHVCNSLMSDPLAEYGIVVRSKDNKIKAQIQRPQLMYRVFEENLLVKNKISL